MDALLLIAALSGWLAAIGCLLWLGAAARRRQLRAALALRARLLPYLRRRASELGVEAPERDTRLADADEVVRAICDLAERLADAERPRPPATEPHEAIADTLPVGNAGTGRGDALAPAAGGIRDAPPRSGG